MRKLKTLEMHRLTVEEYREAEKLPLALVLDDVRSAYNVGSLFRTADAFRVARICLCGITAVPPSTEIHKTALGAELAVEWKHYDSAMEAVQDLQQEGWRVYAVEQAEGSEKLPFAEPKADEKLAIVLGNEVKGVHQDVVDACNGCFEIPQRGTKHSMNVACAGAVVIWELARSFKEITGVNGR